MKTPFDTRDEYAAAAFVLSAKVHDAIERRSKRGVVEALSPWMYEPGISMFGLDALASIYSTTRLSDNPTPENNWMLDPDAFNDGALESSIHAAQLVVAKLNHDDDACAGIMRAIVERGQSYTIATAINIVAFIALSAGMNMEEGFCND